MKKLLLTLFLGICLLNTSTAYSVAILDLSEDYNIEINSFGDEDYDHPITGI